MYTPQYKVSRMKVSREQMDTYRWHRGKWAASFIHKGKFLKRGEGRKRGEKRERVTPDLPDLV